MAHTARHRVAWSLLDVFFAMYVLLAFLYSTSQPYATTITRGVRAKVAAAYIMHCGASYLYLPTDQASACQDRRRCVRMQLDQFVHQFSVSGQTMR
jgi:hypothetical protein